MNNRISLFQLTKSSKNNRLYRVFHATPFRNRMADNLTRDNKVAGRTRFYEDVGIKPIPPPWADFESGLSVDIPISVGVDGTKSATNISRDKPSYSSMKEYLDPTEISTSLDDQLLNWFGITLDGRFIKTPLGTTLSVPSLPLAVAIASEWESQNETIKPAQMPLMTLACTALDQMSIPIIREHTIEELLKYIRNDTTCYWADGAEDRILFKRQMKAWGKLHQWVACETHGLGSKPAVATGTGEGLIMSRVRNSKRYAGLPHDDTLVKNGKQFLQQCNAWKLASMQSVTMEAKSFFVGMAVVKSVESLEVLGKVNKNPFIHDLKEAVIASRVEEEFQIENWGLVEGGHDYDRLNCSIQIHAASCLVRSISSTHQIRRIHRKS